METKEDTSIKKPSEEYSVYWLYHSHPFWRIMYGDPDGKWLLFFRKTVLDEKWEFLKKIYDENMLVNVISLKVSTIKPNPYEKDKDYGVICLFCANSDNKDEILETGYLIKKLIGDYDFPEIRYKSDEQTFGIVEGDFLYKI